ncbi:MAG TPA: hypothetical protein VHO06_26015 [Polyangia bacterium]|nr:hypothetical protein [Polyangia bacterium]
MSDRRERASSARWVAWMPLLFVAAFLYWSVALGLGGLSLMAASALSSDLVPAGEVMGPTAVEPAPGRADVPIMVHLEESAEPEDVDDNAGAVPPVDTIEDDATTPPAGQGAN